MRNVSFSAKPFSVCLWNAYITSVGSIALTQNVELTVDAIWSSCQTTVKTPGKILEGEDPEKGFGCPGKWLKIKVLGKHPWQSAISKKRLRILTPPPQAPLRWGHGQYKHTSCQFCCSGLSRKNLCDKFYALVSLVYAVHHFHKKKITSSQEISKKKLRKAMSKFEKTNRYKILWIIYRVF